MPEFRLFTHTFHQREKFWSYTMGGFDKIFKRHFTSPMSSPGAGAGKGGGGGGSIKEAGGGLGKYGAANEEDYFYHKGKELLARIKNSLKESKPDSKKSP